MHFIAMFATFLYVNLKSSSIPFCIRENARPTTGAFSGRIPTILLACSCCPSGCSHFLQAYVPYAVETYLLLCYSCCELFAKASDSSLQKYAQAEAPTVHHEATKDITEDNGQSQMLPYFNFFHVMADCVISLPMC